MGVNSLPKTVTRQRRDCDLNPGPSAPESSTLTTRLPSHPPVLSVPLLYSLYIAVYSVYMFCESVSVCLLGNESVPKIKFLKLQSAFC